MPGSRFPSWTALRSIERVEIVPLDLTDTESVTEQAEQNGARIDIVVNTAEHVRAGGIVDRHGLTIAREEIDVRYLGLMRLAQAFGPILRARGADGVNSAAAFVNLLSVHALMNWPAYGSYSRDRGGLPVGGAMHARRIAPGRRQGAERLLRPARDRMVPDRAAARRSRRRRSPRRSCARCSRASRTCSWATSPRTSGNASPSIPRRSSAKWRAEAHVRARPICWPSRGAVAAGDIHVIDLTQTLSQEFPTIVMPPELGQCAPFRMEEVSRYDERGPAWYWNNISRRRAYRHAFRRADPLDLRARICPTMRSTPSTSRNSSRRPRDRLLEGVRRQPGLRADRLPSSSSGRRGTAAIEPGSWVLLRTDWSKRSYAGLRRTCATTARIRRGRSRPW